MDEPPRGAARVPVIMHVAQAAQQLGDDVDRDRERDRAGADHAPQRHALDELHHQAEALLLIAGEVEHGDHVGVAQPGHDARLVDEHPCKVWIRGPLGQHALDGHIALEALRPPEVGTEDLGHASGADALAQLVLASAHSLLLWHGSFGSAPEESYTAYSSLDGITWYRHAIFIAELAFRGAPGILGMSKLAILGATAMAGMLAMAIGILALPKELDPEVAAKSPADVEASTEF